MLEGVDDNCTFLDSGWRHVDFETLVHGNFDNNRNLEDRND